MSGIWLEFEKPVVDLEVKIQELRDFAASSSIEVGDELARLEKKADTLRRDIYHNLSRWQRVQLARHPRRPYTLDYLQAITDEFMELHGDRAFSDDRSIVGAWPGSTDAPWWWWVTRRDATPRRTWSGTSGCRTPRVTARRFACSSWPIGSGCRC